jgi:hypothetical protein
MKKRVVSVCIFSLLVSACIPTGGGGISGTRI